MKFANANRARGALTRSRMPDRPFTFGAIVTGVGSRRVGEALGPVAIFLLGSKLIGLSAGIGLAAALALGVFVHERRHGRPAVLVRVAFTVAALRAVVGLSSGSASSQLAEQIGIDVLLACFFIGSVIANRPITTWIAADMYPFTPEVRSSDTFFAVMRTVTTVWGGYFLARAAVRLAALLTVSADHYALVAAVTEAPFLVVLIGWSVHHTSGTFRRSALVL